MKQTLFKKFNGISFRPATPEDYKPCRRLVNQKENRAGFGMFDRVSFDDFAQRQQQEPRYMLWVAEKDHAIVGFVRALLLKNKSRTTIHAICRDYEQKGAGLGQHLMSMVEDFTRHHNVGLIRLRTPEGTDAGKAYERFGFRCTQKELPEGKRRRTVCVYEKKL